MVDDRGIEPRISACKADVFPLALVARNLYRGDLFPLSGRYRVVASTSQVKDSQHMTSGCIYNFAGSHVLNRMLSSITTLGTVITLSHRYLDQTWLR